MLTRDMAGKREGNLEEDGVGGAVGHAELAQLEGGAQVGGKEARAEHRRLVPHPGAWPYKFLLVYR